MGDLISVMPPAGLTAGWIAPKGWSALAQAVVAQGTLTRVEMTRAQARAQALGVPLAHVLATDWALSPAALAQDLALTFDLQQVNPVLQPAEPDLVASFGLERVIEMQIMPWRRVGGVTVVLCCDPDAFDAAAPMLTRLYGLVRRALTTEPLMRQALGMQFGDTLCAAAESRVPARYSSRGWRRGRAAVAGLVALGVGGLAAVQAPLALFTVLCLGAAGLLALSSALKLAALMLAPSGYRGHAPRTPAAPLPVITLLVPLHDETRIADHLLRRLEALTYPRALLDVCLVLEQGDQTTRHALGLAALPTWMRVIAVPEGTLKTKPRALNYALAFARGSIVGIYDAEDAPDPDQLTVVADSFAAAPPDVACLQGTLDYYNPTTNWITRCFTIEYASWFRVVLPGIARMGLVVPLGGTTLFLRREVITALGAWDAHNVTEDADLGIRLARFGYRTAFIPTVTEEEANGRAWPFVKQRSRWLKGYAITWAVHMRSPRRLWQDLGAWKFWGVQLLFGGTLLQFVLAPMLWSFWLLPLGLPHPLGDVLPRGTMLAIGGFFLMTEILNIAIGFVAVRRAGKPGLSWWTPTMTFYFPLAVVAVYRGLLELAWKPFYWDKTEHGIFVPAIPRPRPPPRRA